MRRTTRGWFPHGVPFVLVLVHSNTETLAVPQFLVALLRLGSGAVLRRAPECVAALEFVGPAVGGIQAPGCSLWGGGGGSEIMTTPFPNRSPRIVETIQRSGKRSAARRSGAARSPQHQLVPPAHAHTLSIEASVASPAATRILADRVVSSRTCVTRPEQRGEPKFRRSKTRIARRWLQREWARWQPLLATAPVHRMSRSCRASSCSCLQQHAQISDSY